MKKKENPTIACLCGCGETFPQYDPNGRRRRYLPGHQTMARASRRSMRAAQARRRTYTPLVLKDLGKAELITISSLDPRLFVDEEVQRMELKPWVNELIVALEAGGKIPDPIVLAERPDGKLSVVDGQQRWWAAWNLGRSLEARVYKSRGLEWEQTLFSILNNRVRVRTETAVHSWPGPSGQLIRQWADSQESPFFMRVNFGRNNRAPYNGSTLARSLADLLLPGRGNGRTNEVLARLDKALAMQGTSRKVEAFAKLYNRIFPGPARACTNPSRALARACRVRWNSQIRMPTARSITRINKINWQHETGGQRAERYIAVLQAAIEKRWEE